MSAVELTLHMCTTYTAAGNHQTLSMRRYLYLTNRKPPDYIALGMVTRLLQTALGVQISVECDTQQKQGNGGQGENLQCNNNQIWEGDKHQLQTV